MVEGVMAVEGASFPEAVERLKALGEPTRLRLAILLARHDLTVSDLTAILGQSQPRISRHLRLLTETGILTRYQEGAWAYFRLADDPAVGALVALIAGRIAPADPMLARDAEHLETVRTRRAANAARYFAANAARWDAIRSLHVPDADVEAALVEALAVGGAYASILDIGTGTGRMLELLAPGAERSLGLDTSREMLSLARAKLDKAGLPRASVRQGDAYRLPVEADSFDLVTLHQVLHYLDDPQAAVAEAARALAPGGRLAIIDFAPHGHEFLRESHAHLRLGFAPSAIEGFLGAAGLELESSVSLAPPGGGSEELTVIVSVGRDRRAARLAGALKKTG